MNNIQILKKIYFSLLLLIVLSGVLLVAQTSGKISIFGHVLLSSALAADLNNTVNPVTESSGAFTCDFSLGYICLISQGAGNFPLTPTLTNLPTNAFVRFVMNMTNLKSTAWPANVHCNLADAFATCGNVNGYSVAGGKYSTTFWSDGSDLWASPDTGNIQTGNFAHVNVSAFQNYSILTNGPGTSSQLFGSTMIFGATNNCSSATSPASCSNYITGSVALAAATTTLTVNTTNITANSVINISPDSGLSSKLGITCNSGTPSWHIGSRTAGVGFTLVVDVAPITNPYCFGYWYGN